MTGLTAVASSMGFSHGYATATVSKCPAPFPARQSRRTR
jgi:hypothetical protein